MSQGHMGLGPLMGFALWHLQRGVPLAEVEQMIAAAPQFGGIPPEDVRGAISGALTNLQITEAAQTFAGGRNIGEATGQVVSGLETFGVRVLLTHTDPNGQQSVASVVVNAAASNTIDQILEAAREYAESGQLAQHTGHASPGTWGAAAVAQVVQGGYPNAVITHMS